MKLTFYSPSEHLSYDISALEVETLLGDFVILEHHAPIILLLKPGTNVMLSLKNEEKKSIPIAGGILKVNRTEATIILTE